MYDVSMKIPKHQIDAVNAEFRKLPHAITQAAAATTEIMSGVFMADVKNNYAVYRGDNPTLAASTLERRKFGRRGGERYSSIRPLWRSGKLHHYVTMRRGGGAHYKENVVFLRPSMRLPGGKGISDRVGVQNEFGKSGITFDITPKMRRFLHALLEKSGRREEAMGGGLGFGGSSITINIPARPVWQPAIRRLFTRQPHEFAKTFLRELQMRTKFQIVGKGI